MAPGVVHRRPRHGRLQFPLTERKLCGLQNRHCLRAHRSLFASRYTQGCQAAGEADPTEWASFRLEVNDVPTRFVPLQESNQRFQCSYQVALAGA
jgi:hypothetical protein